MKRLLFALTALTISVPAAAGWVQFMKFSTSIVYIDSTSVRKEGDTRTAMVLVDMNQKEPDGVQSKLGRSEIDCQALRMRIHDLTGFPGNMASGDPVYAFSGSTDWMPIPPDSALGNTLKLVCSR
jgi:Surface-adhesin protein E